MGRPPYRRVAIIGAGPAGLAAAKALTDEHVFDRIQLYERKGEVGGLWLYDPSPEAFVPNITDAEKLLPLPSDLHGQSPVETPPAPRNGPGVISAAYEYLDTNAGARTMAFTYKPLPLANSKLSVQRYGPGNATRPRAALQTYLEELAAPYRQQISFHTHVERVAKAGEEWVVTLREEGDGHDTWWQETFDAVIAASGHYNVANIPEIAGLEATWKALPTAFVHTKAWRGPASFRGKAILVVGGGVSAVDAVEELHDIVAGPLYVSRRRNIPFLENAWKLPRVVLKPAPKCVAPAQNGHGVVVTFDDDSQATVDVVLFATGYRLSYPFLPWSPAVTAENRLTGFYQHVFRIGDPSLAVLGQVRAAISFRVYEFQAVAVARFLAGHATHDLPPKAEQEEWEAKRLEYKGPTELFHEIKPDFHEYYGWLRDLAGPGEADNKDTYELPEYEDWWEASDVEILVARAKRWEEMANTSEAKQTETNGHAQEK